MENFKQMIELFISDFRRLYLIEQIKNESFNPNREFIVGAIEKCSLEYSKIFKEEFEEFTETEKNILIKNIESIYSIYQEEGYALLGDYKHNYSWYSDLQKTEGYDEYYWPRYKGHLIKNNFPSNVLKTLENDTLKNIMSYLGDPNAEYPFSIRGLVVGDVQSGKTSNYLGLITKAADAGYKVIFILTGTVEGLRRQTQIRAEEAFIGFDTINGNDVGVGRGDKVPQAFTNRLKDFAGSNNQNTSYRISDYSLVPMIFVVKKNVKVLKGIYSSLKELNTRYENQKIDYSALIIDDEADNASINTNNEKDCDPTKINQMIRSILSLFTKTSYVGFTATPFANVFINPESEDEMLGDDLFPKDFIYALSSPTNYCGAKKYFYEQNSNVKFIRDENPSIFPMDHDTTWNGTKLFPSVFKAVNTFLLINAIRDIRDEVKTTHRSMLVNMTRFTGVQSNIKSIIEEYFDLLKNAIKQTYKLPKEVSLTNPYIRSLKETFEEEFGNLKDDDSSLTWENTFIHLYESITPIKIVVVNSSKEAMKLDYSKYKKTGLRVIAIGGLALSRGLTLEGLCVSYFYRSTKTFDVLMQMGRWFGYRGEYEDLCRVYITEEAATNYREISDAIIGLKSDIKRMCSENKKPTDYGIRVRNESMNLKITDPKKMRNTESKIIRDSYFGEVLETPYINRDLHISENNIDHTLDFLGKISLSQRDSKVERPYFRNISTEDVCELLSKISINKNNEKFDAVQVLSFIEKHSADLKYFDVLIIGGESNLKFKDSKLNIDIPLVKRNYDFKNKGLETIIRISATHAHVLGTTDTKYGLSDEQLKAVPRFQNDEITAVKSYMVEDRNPLLIIYFIDLKNKNENKPEDVVLEKELSEAKYNYVVAYAIGFPRNSKDVGSATLYTVNKKANYYEKDHSEGDDVDE